MQSIMKIVSIVFHPLCILFYGFALLMLTNPFLFSGEIDKGILIIKFFVVSFLFPVLVTLMMVGLKLVPSFQMHDKKDRILPLIATMLFYIWLFINLYSSARIPDPLVIITLGSILSLVMGFLINMVYKISFHAIGAGGMVGMGTLIYAFFAHNDFNLKLLGLGWEISTKFLFIMTLLIAGLVMSARTYLKAHTLPQVYAGAALGFMGQMVAYFIIRIIL